MSDKLCKDCKHFSNGGIMSIVVSPFLREFAKCTHPKSAKAGDPINLIARRSITNKQYCYCSTMRQFDCGRNAALFESRVTR